MTREESPDAADVAARSLFHLFAHMGPDPTDQLAAAYDAYRSIPFEHRLTFGAFAGGHIVAMARLCVVFTSTHIALPPAYHRIMLISWIWTVSLLR